MSATAAKCADRRGDRADIAFVVKLWAGGSDTGAERQFATDEGKSAGRSANVSDKSMNGTSSGHESMSEVDSHEIKVGRHCGDFHGAPCFQASDRLFVSLHKIMSVTGDVALSVKIA